MGYLFRWVATPERRALGGSRRRALGRRTRSARESWLQLSSRSSHWWAGPVTGWLSGFGELWILAPFALFLALAISRLPAEPPQRVYRPRSRGLHGLPLYPAAATTGVLHLFFLALLGGGSFLLLHRAFAARGTATALLRLRRRPRPGDARPPGSAELSGALCGVGAHDRGGIPSATEAARAASQAYRYLVFSMGGAFALLLGLAVLGTTGLELAPATLLAALGGAGGPAGAAAGSAGAGEQPSPSSGPAGPLGITAALLILVAVLVKLGALGVHIWLPGSYAEAEDETTALFSAVFSKVPSGLLLALLAAVSPQSPGLRAVLSDSWLDRRRHGALWGTPRGLSGGLKIPAGVLEYEPAWLRAPRPLYGEPPRLGNRPLHSRYSPDL